MENLTPPESSAQDNNPVAAPEKMLNVPPVTLALTVLLLGCFLAWHYGSSMIGDIMLRMVFIPAFFTLEPLAQIHTLLSYGLLHFNWTHFLINATGLLAFGSGIERMMGKKYLLGIFIGGTIIGVLGYWIIYPDSNTPLIGASAGISALFGGLLPLIVKRPQILMASFIFIVMNIVLGMMGLPDDPMRQQDASIAWQAHIAGFLFGELSVLALIRFKIARYKAARQNQEN